MLKFRDWNTQDTEKRNMLSKRVLQNAETQIRCDIIKSKYTSNINNYNTITIFLRLNAETLSSVFKLTKEKYFVCS